MTDDVYVIIGASLAGAKAAETLRDEGFAGRVVLIGEESELPYERPPLSKGYLLGNDPRDGGRVHEFGWYAEHKVELRLGTVAVDLDAARRLVALHPSDSLHYDKLLLATGSRVRTLAIRGSELTGVHYLRTLDQADALLEGLRAGGNVVVVGAGWIGLETAAAARHHGCSVTVAEMDSLPLRRVLGDEVAAIYRDLHVAHGVDFRFGAGLSEFQGEDGHVTGVLLADGTVLPADLIAVGVGIRPAVELAESAGLRVDNGIVTDAMLRTSDEHIWACGDVVSWFHPLLNTQIRVEHWANALNGGPAAARSMLGTGGDYAPVPYFFSDQYDLGMEYAGWVTPGGYDQVVFRGDPTVGGDAAPEFIAFWVAGGRVLAGMNANVWDVTDQIQDLVRAGYAGRSVDLAALADPAVPLDQLLG
ncbi:MAG TPA: FAD-dependent oxidoreductase [Nakamurella sp.]|nr:FAD-dependent oxidoreductase [Nakamurella sp.]